MKLQQLTTINVLQGWKRNPILLYVEIVGVSATHYKEFANKRFDL
jgi:hypothetical protein